MNNDLQLDDVLQSAQAPRVIEGAHRVRLKTKLIQEFRKEQSIVMKHHSQKHVLVWTCLLALFVAAASWAGYGYIKTYIVHEETIQLPDGSTQGVMVSIGSDDPNFSQEVADRQYQEIQQLIGQKKYQFVEKKEVDGNPVFIYQFTLADGTIIHHGTNKPLE